MTEDEVDWENYESGPFCEHYFEPWDCDVLCACGHRCARHQGEHCGADGCDCQAFEEPTNA
jgi:hypothetical protein